MTQLPLGWPNWSCTPGQDEKGGVQIMAVPGSKVSAGSYTSYFICRDKKKMPKITSRVVIAPYMVNPSLGKQSLITSHS